MSYNKLTTKDLDNIFQLLKDKIPGIELRVMPSTVLRPGLGILMLNPEDMKQFSELFEDMPTPITAPLQFKAP
jgi:hypothetical protein